MLRLQQTPTDAESDSFFFFGLVAATTAAVVVTATAAVVAAAITVVVVTATAVATAVASAVASAFNWPCSRLTNSGAFFCCSTAATRFGSSPPDRGGTLIGAVPIA